MINSQTIVYLANSSKPATPQERLTHEVDVNASTLIRFSEHLFSRNPDAHLIYLSSGGQIYGPGHSEPISEENQVDAVTPYALGKVLIEQTLNYLHDQIAAKITILRLSNPIGRWQLNTSHGLVTAAINAAVNDQGLTIFGEGLNQRDYFDVDDFAEFIIKTAREQNPVTGTYNLSLIHISEPTRPY